MGAKDWMVVFAEGDVLGRRCRLPRRWTARPRSTWCGGCIPGGS